MLIFKFLPIELYTGQFRFSIHFPSASRLYSLIHTHIFTSFRDGRGSFVHSLELQLSVHGTMIPSSSKSPQNYGQFSFGTHLPSGLRLAPKEQTHCFRHMDPVIPSHALGSQLSEQGKIQSGLSPVGQFFVHLLASTHRPLILNKPASQKQPLIHSNAQF